MPFVPVPDCARVSLKMQMHGQKVTNNFYVQREGGYSGAQLTQLAELCANWWENDMADNLATQIALHSVTAVDVSAEEQEGVEFAPAAPVAGTKISQAAPGNVTIAVKLVTGFTGRARRGRVYQPGICEDDTEGNQADPLLVTGLANAWLALRGALIAADMELVVASLYDGFELEGPDDDGVIKKVPKPRPVALVTPVTHIVVENNLDSQRRRLHGRGQ